MFSTGTVWKNVAAVRQRAPIIHSITNFVVMNTTANALLAAGASPIMAHAPEEMAEMAGIASALVLNIGTLTKPWVESMMLAGMAARERRLPVVLDPVGAGASSLRTTTALEILEKVRPAVVRGNGSEILALAGAAGDTRGVDSARTAHEAVDGARALARRYGAVVVVSGAEDVVTDGDALWLVRGGSPLMPRVTGMGCTATVLVAAHVAVAADVLEGAVTGMAAMSAAGALAARRSQGPGSFQVAFLDVLHSLDLVTVRDEVEVVRA
ncbi:hydroxyethylthiazole kinase [Nitratidesulfovibrio vulgaris]|jgi:hydroxyethylthiazole kinase|uniref:Hydroxyethylthiazole kinase n=1 Tax=Nitratidesulfovibrio vulgaris (strain DP4) TaxID=391774 RepID=THIM_NITV4|nr:hydroxyethylthiazole kinase [Nitratidesulfovibrio vulgaris]A1VBV4.1 RecName: Full=Hydroxyethylthiazole kinase; AltName: Full=4-methyl-5-beta-hydroxyethylthiazole kinase; Short=TH kinase; Short=Thz kinase [Nitratidesulfovibrio vulgaris DP4]ABM27920.1 hydroxyethylthiazole kinase [Nitratidesulfovibrio vulgaris DP4]WCB45877.1 hydroxyethylthiazole kinase [Nitratidesulfovibrio vulgaris]GEB81090.1 hydroxyethylthiazole kinase [Desulfovibrio desulfuricans]